MKKLGAYIGDSYNGLEKNTFVWYEVFRCLDDMYGNDIYDVSIWSLKGGYPNVRKPDAKFKTTNPQLIENTVIPMKDVVDKYYIEWGDRTWQIQECMVAAAYAYNYEHVTILKVNHIGSNVCSWALEGERAMSTLKNATVSTVGNMIKDELKKSIEQEIMKDVLYGTGGFTITPSNRVLSVNEALKIWENKNKETKTMEKKMTETDTFLKHINGITITSTYSKLDFGNFGDPYYIYYPETQITEDIADTLLTVLLMAKKEYIHKVVFNPEKGTTTIYCNWGSVTVRCKDCEFDYILGYEMARMKAHFGKDDYNWFNKIKNHRKTHIEYTEKPTEPKAKRTSKKGGKK